MNPNLAIAAAKKCTADHFLIDVAMMHGESRHVGVPRSIAMYLSREVGGAPFAHIGHSFNRDRTTAQHAHRRVGDRIPMDPALRDVVASIEGKMRRLGGVGPYFTPTDTDAWNAHMWDVIRADRSTP